MIVIIEAMKAINFTAVESKNPAITIHTRYVDFFKGVHPVDMKQVKAPPQTL